MPLATAVGFALATFALWFGDYVHTEFPEINGWHVMLTILISNAIGIFQGIFITATSPKRVGN